MKDFKPLKFSLIICTYERTESLKRLLDSLSNQSLYPDEVLVIDGSHRSATEEMISQNAYTKLIYYRVDDTNRGLTRQRNFGINKSGNVNIICFLDDDIVPEPDYFFHLISSYKERPDAIAVGGWIKNESQWKKIKNGYQQEFNEFLFDGYVRKLGQRNILRKRLGLLSDKPPGFMPDFSHGLSISFLPPSGKVYPVEFFMGGVSSYKKELFKKINFSKYFEGYGLYEDMDFCLRASEIEKLYVNTGARVMHLHAESGRPDYLKYGKMVVRNGFYVWKIKNPEPDLVHILKWNSITILLILIRLSNSFNSADKVAAFKDSMGRTIGWLSLIFQKPRGSTE